MKRSLCFFLFAILLTSCTSVKQIGKINMISIRNVDPNLKYQVLSSYSGGSASEIKRTEAKSIEEAIEQTVKKVPGGEFLMNAKIYIIKDQYFAVEGDVWGSSLTGPNVKGFKPGDRVTWKSGSKFSTGVIAGLKDLEHCLVKLDNENDRTVEVDYEKLTKTGNEPSALGQDSVTSMKSQSKGYCFIATACYGNYDAYEVKILRQYRDSILLKTGLGQRAVNAYYLLSPPFAKALEKSEISKAFVRKYVLGPIIEKITQNNNLQ